jgi:predicted DNA-binding transcriptional regulator
MYDPKFCFEHKCIKDKIDAIRTDKLFWNKLFSSKWFFWVVTGLIILWLGFNGWVVREIYAQKANEQESKKVTEIIYKDVKEIKQELKEENKKRDEQREADQKELVKILMDIQKQIKK